MIIRLHRLFLAALGLALGLGLGLSGAGPAAATVSTSCKGYSGCARLGMSDAGYGAANKSMYWRMYSGHNCTNYAAYRMIKAGMSSSRPWSGSGNATNWGAAMKHLTNSTPTVGSIAWWKAGVRPAGSAGHVAYVERVVSAEEIIVSQDSWNGDFSWARVTRSGTGWPSGFIHFRDPPQVSTVPANPPPPTHAPQPQVAAPSLRGVFKPGRTVEVVLPGMPNGLSRSVQWLRSGKPITGATQPTYSVSGADLGTRLRAEVRYVGNGYSPRVTSTPATAIIRVPAGVRVSTVSGKRRFTFHAQVTGYAGAPVNGTLQVRQRGRVLRSVPIRDGVASGAVSRLRPGNKVYRFRSTFGATTTRGEVAHRVRVLR